MTQPIDSAITNLFVLIRTQTQHLQTQESLVQALWKTNCSFAFPFAANTPINIQTAPEHRIKSIVSFLLQHQHFNELTEKTLNLEPNLLYEGFSFQDWIDDCKKRIAHIQNRTRKAKLKELEQRLNQIVSPEDKRKMEFDAITKELSLHTP
jgi:hypothetical protein